MAKDCDNKDIQQKTTKIEENKLNDKSEKTNENPQNEHVKLTKSPNNDKTTDTLENPKIENAKIMRKSPNKKINDHTKHIIKHVQMDGKSRLRYQLLNEAKKTKIAMFQTAGKIGKISVAKLNNMVKKLIKLKLLQGNRLEMT